MRVLVADNNAKTLEFLNTIFSKEGFEVVTAGGGHEAVSLFYMHKPDFVCLDIVMPDLTGYDVCKEIRRTDETIPVIFISAKNKVSDKIAGLELGADDYITKPFDISEVIARIRAVARRCFRQNTSVDEISQSYSMGEVEIFPKKLKAQRGDQKIDLSLRELNILKILYDNKNNVVSRDALLDFCWGMHIMPESRTVAWHISQLRKRIERDSKDPEIIKTVHGVGYKYEE